MLVCVFLYARRHCSRGNGVGVLYASIAYPMHRCYRAFSTCRGGSCELISQAMEVQSVAKRLDACLMPPQDKQCLFSLPSWNVRWISNRLPIAHQHANGHRRNFIRRSNKRICNVVPISLMHASHHHRRHPGSFHVPSIFIREKH